MMTAIYLAAYSDKIWLLRKVDKGVEKPSRFLAMTKSVSNLLKCPKIKTVYHLNQPVNFKK